MSGICYKGRIEGLDISVAYSDTFELVNQVIIMHDCDPVAAHLIGRSITAGVMAASLLADRQRINISWRYPGLLKSIVVDAGQDGSVRGMISPQHLEQASENEALYGDIGDIRVVTSHKEKILNSGTTPVSLHDPVNDFSYHLSLSDQIETSMRCVIAFQANTETPVLLSHGIMIQALPSCNLEIFDRVRNKLQSEWFLKKMTAELMGNDVRFILESLVEDEEGFFNVVLHEVASPYFSCSCSKKKMKAVIRSLPIPERMDMVKKGENIKINCQFCSQTYLLSIEECIAAWNSKPND